MLVAGQNETQKICASGIQTNKSALFHTTLIFSINPFSPQFFYISTHQTDSADSRCFSFFSGMSVLTLALWARLSWLLVSFEVHNKSLQIIIHITIIGHDYISYNCRQVTLFYTVLDGKNVIHCLITIETKQFWQYSILSSRHPSATSNGVVKPEVGEKEVDVRRQSKLADEGLSVGVKHGGVVVV